MPSNPCLPKTDIPLQSHNWHKPSWRPRKSMLWDTDLEYYLKETILKQNKTKKNITKKQQHSNPFLSSILSLDIFLAYHLYHSTFKCPAGKEELKHSEKTLAAQRSGFITSDQAFTPFQGSLGNHDFFPFLLSPAMLPLLSAWWQQEIYKRRPLHGWCLCLHLTPLICVGRRAGERSYLLSRECTHGNNRVRTRSHYPSDPRRIKLNQRVKCLT